MPSISIRNVSYIYNQDLPFEKRALNQVNLDIHHGEFIALVGHTGSGKSTLVQHLNGLMEPTEGEILYEGTNFRDKGNIATLRQKVGLVFQYPEYQLFEETIAKDIAYGPKNLGLTDDEVEDRVRRAMARVGLDYDEKGEKSPFALSGGQKRRVALLRALWAPSDTLLLDEPFTGMDPDTLQRAAALLRQRCAGKPVLLATHDKSAIRALGWPVVELKKLGRS